MKSDGNERDWTCKEWNGSRIGPEWTFKGDDSTGLAGIKEKRGMTWRIERNRAEWFKERNRVDFSRRGLTGLGSRRANGR